MPNIASLLRQEIARVARRELRKETAALKKASAIHRAEIGALKRRAADMERQLRDGAKSSSPAASGAANDDSIAEGSRFSPKGLAAHRKRLGLSVAELGLPIGVSAQSIYNWESGKARPLRKHLPTLVALRTVGKKETHAHLEELQKAA